jgi:hypothetical protein
VVAVSATVPTIQAEAPPETSSATPAEEAGGVVLKLSATERTWLSISSGGKEIFAGTLQPSESKTLTGLERATMKVGNAGGIEVRVNGKVIGPLGTRGANAARVGPGHPFFDNLSPATESMGILQPALWSCIKHVRYGRLETRP